MNNKISLIGAPTDIGAGTRGASMGPEALRVAGLHQVLQGHGLAVEDRGNLIGPANPWRPFCSARCRGSGLGAWASEDYRVPAQPPVEDDEPPPDR